MQVDPIKPQLKPPGTKRLKLKCDILLSTFAFRFLRRYTKDKKEAGYDIKDKRLVLTMVGWCRLTPSNPR